MCMLLIKLYLWGQGMRTNVWIRAQVLMDQSLWRRTSLPSPLLPSAKEQAAEGTQRRFWVPFTVPLQQQRWSYCPSRLSDCTAALCTQRGAVLCARGCTTQCRWQTLPQKTCTSRQAEKIPLQCTLSSKSYRQSRSEVCVPLTPITSGSKDGSWSPWPYKLCACTSGEYFTLHPTIINSIILAIW